MSKAITIEFLAESESLRRKLGKLSRVAAADNPYRGQSEGEILRRLVIEALGQHRRRHSQAAAAIEALYEEAIATLVAALEKSIDQPAPEAPIAPGSYTRETLPPLGTRAQNLLESIWNDAETAVRPKAAKGRRRPGARKPRGRLKLTDHGGDSVIEYLTRR
jgi:hypothetical protein